MRSFDCGEADSIALDLHKLLFAPLEAGCLLARDRGTLQRAFGFASSYLTASDDRLLTDYMEYRSQLSRSVKAFKGWCALRTFDVAAFRTAINHTLDVTQYMADRIESELMPRLMGPVILTAVGPAGPRSLSQPPAWPGLASVRRNDPGNLRISVRRQCCRRQPGTGIPASRPGLSGSNRHPRSRSGPKSQVIKVTASRCQPDTHASSDRRG